MSALFPALNLDNWQPTRNSLKDISQLMGKIRRALTPPHPQWWHVSLHVNAKGLTTTPIPTGNGQSFTIDLNLIEHALILKMPAGNPIALSLQNQRLNEMTDFVLQKLAAENIHPEIDPSLFSNTELMPYNPEHATTLFTTLHSVNESFQRFQKNLDSETSPVQLWPHHFDLSLVWFSGREAIVPEGEEGGAEQVGFGFSTGDETIPDAYFYANPWPVPVGILDTPLPQGAEWHSQGWTGGLLHYEKVTNAENPQQVLFDFLQAVQRNSAALMKK